MERVETTDVEPSVPGPTPKERGAIYDFFGAIRTRIVSGLILALPIAITFWIVIQLYLTLQGVVIKPTIAVIQWLAGPERMQELPWWWQDYVSPIVAARVRGKALLYFLGLFVSTRLARTIDWLMSRVPVVTTIYQAVRGVFQSLGSPKGPGRFWAGRLGRLRAAPGTPRAGVRDADDARGDVGPDHPLGLRPVRPAADLGVRPARARGGRRRPRLDRQRDDAGDRERRPVDAGDGPVRPRRSLLRARTSA